MSRLSIGAASILIVGQIALAVPASAQEGTRARAPASSITLDQLSTSNSNRAGGASSTSDLDIPQPPSPSRTTAVISSEIPVHADSRALETGPIAGTDRCDPAADRKSARPCRRPLETRAGDYARPRATPVTPEGRLLLLVSPTGGATPFGGIPGLSDPNGPAEQIAGALQSQGTDPDPSTAGSSTTAGTTVPLPTGVPPIVVLPTK